MKHFLQPLTSFRRESCFSSLLTRHSAVESNKGGLRGICSSILRYCFVGLLIVTTLSIQAQAAEPKPVLFDWFEYRGDDAAFTTYGELIGDQLFNQPFSGTAPVNV